MTTSANPTVRLLAEAQDGSREALGRLLQACRGYLLRIARQALDPALAAKGGASDLVQETFLEAHRDFERFRGTSETELLAWLRRLLLNNLANFARHYRGTGKRHLGREVVLDPGNSSTAPDRGLIAATPSPSGQAVTREQAEALERALGRLPEEHFRVLALRNQERLTFEEIGARTGRSADAARRLWVRAVERLQQELGEC